MPKKKIKKNKDIIKETFEQMDVEPAEKNVPKVESGLDEVEAVVADEGLQDEVDIGTDLIVESLPEASLEVEETLEVMTEEGLENEGGTSSDLVDEPLEKTTLSEEETSADDLFDDVRSSLIKENEEIKKEKKPGWWQRIRSGARKEKEPVEVIPNVDVPEELVTVNAESVLNDREDVDESIDELIEMIEVDKKDEPLEADLIPDVDIEQEEIETEVEKVDVDELKKRVFRGSTPEDQEESISDVRSVALDGGEEVFVEVEIQKTDPVDDRLKSLENALRPYKRYIYFGIAFIGIVVILATSALLYDAYQRSLPPEPIKEAEALPYPVVMNMPGGLSFNLGRGTLEKGRWDPRRPEWLEGTEICRWVAIPYSRQLEAVVRTLTQDDQLELVMSNNDRWAYQVYSITQMTIEDMQKTSSNKPCLLLVLADVNTDTRWVVTAYP